MFISFPPQPPNNPEASRIMFDEVHWHWDPAVLHVGLTVIRPFLATTLPTEGQSLFNLICFCFWIFKKLKYS